MTTLDTSVPYYPVLMVLNKEVEIPKVSLAQGYYFQRFDPGYTEDWVRLHVLLGQLDSFEEGMEYFEETFAAKPEELRRQMILIVDELGRLAGTSSVWSGDHFGKERLRVHWVGVHPDHQKKGLARSLMLETISLYQSMDQKEPLYLTTQTNSYVAIHLYKQLGFEPYKGEMPVNFKANARTFQEDNETAWRIIDEKLSELK